MTDNQQPRARRRWTVVLVVALVVLVGSLVAIGAIFVSYLQGQQQYSQLAEHVDLVGDGDVDDGAGWGFEVDWAALTAVNPDVVAWVYIPGTNINYPVVRGADNEYYLTHDFDGDEGWLADYGCIFMDYRNDPDWSDEAYFLYGHHMRDGSMFADIAKLADQERFDASREVYVLSPSRNFKLRTFSLIHCADNDPIVQIDFNSTEEMASYIRDKIDRSVVACTDAPDPNHMSKLFAFATCDNASAGRYVLYAYPESEE